jgi:DNA-binding Lrp family transcriptional regulator
MQSYVLIHTEAGRARAVAEEARRISDVVFAEVVTGPYDVVVRAESRTLGELSHGVIAPLQSIPGVIRTVACPSVAHRALWDEELEPAYAAR